MRTTGVHGAPSHILCWRSVYGQSFVGLWDIHGRTTLRFPEFRRVSVRVESEGVKGKETSIDEVCAGIDADMYSGWNRFKSLRLFKTQNQL